MGLAASRYFLSVTRELLRLQDTERPADLFKRSGVPRSPGYRVISFYEKHNALQNAPTGLAVDIRKVISLAGGLRADRAVPDRVLVKGPPLHRAAAILHELKVPFALGFQSAANVHAYFEPSNVSQVYIQQPGGPRGPARTELTVTGQVMFPDRLDYVAGLAATLLGDSLSTRSQVYELFIDDLGPLDCVADRNFPVTSALQTVLDLATHARTAAHLEFMLDFLRKQGGIRG